MGSNAHRLKLSLGLECQFNRPSVQFDSQLLPSLQLKLPNIEASSLPLSSGHQDDHFDHHHQVIIIIIIVNFIVILIL